ncbi:MAG: hypothetical protein KBT46_02950 [Ruminococcus sp.]|nr:hypothetical protein [Candidatus Copronaster equi]
MKAFIITVSCLVAFSIACITTNISIDKLTTSPALKNSGVTNQSGEQNNAPNGEPVIINSGNSAEGSTNADNSNQGSALNANSSNPGAVQVNGNGSGSKNSVANKNASNQQQANPLSYNKAQLINYYNNALRKTYSQPRFTVTKTEVIDVTLGELLLNGKPATGIQNLVDKVMAANKAKGGTKTQTFSSNPAVDAQERFILPSNLSSAAVRSYNVSKSGSGYVIKFTLNQESCDFTRKPPYNSSCTFPLDFTEIDLGGIGEITAAQFYYPGTTLQATIAGQGRVVRTYVEMPLSVNDAKGRGMGQELQVDISGKWLCTNIMSF